MFLCIEEQVFVGNVLFIHAWAKPWNLEDMLAAVLLGFHHPVDCNECAVQVGRRRQSEGWRVGCWVKGNGTMVPSLIPD